MSSEGLKMLVEHLRAYKDTTGQEIEYLKRKIEALRKQHDIVEDEIDERRDILEDHERIIQNLQSVNSRKYRAEERGDWQTLVESLNEDRDYLNKDLEEIRASTVKLVETSAEITDEITDAEREVANLRQKIIQRQPQAKELELQSIEQDDEIGTNVKSSPRYQSLIEQHKENHDLHTTLLAERQAAQDEDAAFQERVQKQRQQLHALRAENQQLILAYERMFGAGQNGDGAQSQAVSSFTFRKIFRLCGRPDEAKPDTSSDVLEE